MSNIYIQEPPTNGKILLKTSIGDIDIELWSKEAPLACRNFTQLCLEGYYDNTIFHRVVKGFIIQGGDPTGTGTGGESIYGEPFKDEIHSRLRFNRRGLVAMANAGKNDNASQFFFTMGATPELQKKHTIFAKIGGKTIYNVLKLEEGEINTDDRPLFPNKILSTEVLHNPFPEIVPRIKTSTKSLETTSKKKPTAQAVKNFKLLSFGEEAEDDEGQIHEINKKFHGKTKHMPGLHETDDLPGDVPMDKRYYDSDSSSGSEEDSRSRKLSKTLQIAKVHEKLNPSSAIVPTDSEKDTSESKLSWAKDTLKEPPPKKSNHLIDDYNKEKDKYSDMKKSLPQKGKSRENQTMELLAKFRKKLMSSQQSTSEKNEEEPKQKKIKKGPTSVEEGEDGENWLAHSLKCDEDVVLAKDANQKSDDWFDITDPRNAINKRRRENSSQIKSRIKHDLK